MNNRILITGGHVVAAGGDVAFGKVVIPGLVDTHRHLWETVLRNYLPDGDLFAYVAQVLTLGSRFTPEDVYASNLLGVAGALDAGITTLLDWSHISNTPAPSDAAIAALQVSGIRAVYAHSTGLDPMDVWVGPESTARHPQDLRRIVEQHRSADDSLLTLAAGVRGPEFSSYEAAWDDIRLARELGLRITLHAGASALGARNTVEMMEREGLLGPDLTFIHLNTSSDRALQLIADSGGTVSSSPAVEAVMGHGAPPFARFDKVGLAPSLSVDAEVGVAGDLFGVMRSAYEQSRTVSHTEVREGREATLHTTRDVLGWGTLEGARALGLDDHIGSLAVGKQADVVVLDLGGLHEGPVNEAVGAVVLNGSPSAVRDVLVAGRVVKRGGVLLGLDVGQLIDAGAATRDRLLKVGATV